MNVSIVIPTIRAKPEMLINAEFAAESVTGDKPVVVDGGTFAENCNRGAAETDAGIIVFLNDDVEVIGGYEQWLYPLIDPIVRDPSVAITGAKLLYPNLTIQHAGVYLTVDDGLITARNMVWNTASGPVQAVTGACMAVRRAVFDGLGGFDEGFRNGYEDVDLCLRARGVGHQVIYVAESVLVHHESQSGPARWASVGENIARLQSKWVDHEETPVPTG